MRANPPASSQEPNVLVYQTDDGTTRVEVVVFYLMVLKRLFLSGGSHNG